MRDDVRVITERVIARIDREYSEPDRADAYRMVAWLGEELSAWKEVSGGDRVERAALTFADGDLARLRVGTELALRDWRDLLVAVGDA